MIPSILAQHGRTKEKHAGRTQAVAEKMTPFPGQTMKVLAEESSSQLTAS